MIELEPHNSLWCRWVANITIILALNIKALVLWDDKPLAQDKYLSQDLNPHFLSPDPLLPAWNEISGVSLAWIQSVAKSSFISVAFTGIHMHITYVNIIKSEMESEVHTFVPKFPIQKF